jgi:hypothetical protein
MARACKTWRRSRRFRAIRFRCELLEPDQLFVNLLTFPIIREGTAGQQHPTGRGRYLLSANGDRMTPNEDYPLEPGCIKTVELVVLEDSAAASFYLKTA